MVAIKAHALLHRHNRPVDERGQIIADIWEDYRPVADLIGGIVAEASGAGIQKEIQETIDAVATTTAGLAPDEGATADKIAKLLRLDKSSAWRRLNKTAFKGFIVNLETRRGQPGRYRVTNQEVEVEDLLPPPEDIEASLGGGLQPVQPCNATNNRQAFETLSDCAAGCTVAPVASDGDPFAGLKDPVRNVELVASVADVADFEERAAILEYEGGMTRADAEALAAEEIPDLPAFLDRRAGIR